MPSKQTRSATATKSAAKAPGKIVPPPTKRAKRAAGAEKTAANTAPAEKSTPDAVDLLVDGHLAADACFKKYEKLAKADADGSEREALAHAVCAMLKTHTMIEEEIFYPAAREAGIDEDMLDEADVEHASAKDLIAQIESMQPEDDLYDAKVTVLGEYIAHHVKEEQAQMFPKCRRSQMDLVGLREELEARKAEIEAGQL